MQLSCKLSQHYYFKDQKLCQYSKKCLWEKNVTNTEEKLWTTVDSQKSKISFCKWAGVGKDREHKRLTSIVFSSSFPSNFVIFFSRISFFFLSASAFVSFVVSFNRRMGVHVTECRCLHCNYLMLTQFYIAEPAA